LAQYGETKSNTTKANKRENYSQFGRLSQRLAWKRNRPILKEVSK